jgi:AcrR family transcriptional regulator
MPTRRARPERGDAGAAAGPAPRAAGNGTRHQPVQRRSRERVEQILAAADELLAQGGVEALTTRSLAEHAGIPVATIYRYFDNRDAIIAAYLGHQLEEIERAVTSAVLGIERVTIRSLVEAVGLAHMRHHQAHPEGVQVWFGGRLNAAVVERVGELDERQAAALRAAVRGTGMTANVPDFAADLIVRLFDRQFEFIFTTPRTAAEQQEIVLALVDMVSTYLERYATPVGLEGVPAAEFLAALGGAPANDDASPSPRPPSRSGKRRRAR